MMIFAAILGLLMIGVVLMDAFEVIVLPRTVMRRIRLSNWYFQISTKVYRAAGRIQSSKLRQSFLVAFAPMTLLGLIVWWAFLMIGGWGLICWSAEIAGKGASLGDSLYFSGATFLTLGYGDLVPKTGLGRTLSILEAGCGFGYIALVIGYVPVLYSAFSRREVQILLLDSRAGSHPMGSELLRRFSQAGTLRTLESVLKDWERFAAELLESYLSYPLLAYYRSQHDNQSWLKSLTAVMDACALIEVGLDDEYPGVKEVKFQAHCTFAMARHVIVDLAYILNIAPKQGDLTRLEPGGFQQICQRLRECNLHLKSAAGDERHLAEIRQMYEPYIAALAEQLVLDLPLWVAAETKVDNWQISAWEGKKHF